MQNKNAVFGCAKKNTTDISVVVLYHEDCFFCQSSAQSQDGVRAVVKHSQIVLFFSGAERSP